MGVRLFGNVKLPTLRFGITVPAIGPALFDARDFNDHIIRITVNGNINLTQVETYLDEEPSVSQYFDNGIQFTSNALQSGVELSQIETYLDEQPTENIFYNATELNF